MALLLASLFIMVVLTILSFISGGTIQASVNYYDILIDEGNEVSQLLSALGYDNFGMSLTAFNGAIAIIFGAIAGISLIGIQVLGTGLSDQASRVLMYATVFLLIWALFSVYSWSMIFSIETWGAFIYLGITIVYAIGVIQILAEGS